MQSDTSKPWLNREEKRAARGDKNRLRRWYDSVQKSKISRAAKGYCIHLGRRSSPTAKLVWGGQKKLAQEMGCSIRQIQRYQKECEKAGLISVHRGPIIRESDGTIRREHVNRYSLCAPTAKTKRQKPRSYRRDTNVTQNNILTDVNTTFGSKNHFHNSAFHKECEGTRWIFLASGEVTRCECIKY